MKRPINIIIDIIEVHHYNLKLERLDTTWGYTINSGKRVKLVKGGDILYCQKIWHKERFFDIIDKSNFARSVIRLIYRYSTKKISKMINKAIKHNKNFSICSSHYTSDTIRRWLTKKI